MTPGAAPRLWHFRVSHYNEKVRWALDHKRWAHTRTTLLPGFHVPVARWISGQSRLPILKLDSRVLIGSGRILEEIERLRPEPPLFPDDPAERARATAIQAHFDAEVAPDLDHDDACVRMATDGSSSAARAIWRVSLPAMRPLFRRNMGMTSAELGAARQRMRSHFDRLESEIGPDGFLVGKRFGIADLATAAVMTAIVRPPEFPYSLPEPCPAEFVELRESMSNHAAFQWVLDIYARFRGTSSEIELNLPVTRDA